MRTVFSMVFTFLINKVYFLVFSNAVSNIYGSRPI